MKTRAEWESAILSAHAVRKWTVKGERGRIADELVVWANEQMGGAIGFHSLQELIMDLSISVRPWTRAENVTIVHCRVAVLEFFKGDEEKVSAWFSSQNPLLGGITPNAMIEMGREEKLLRMIRNQIEGNRP